MPGKLAKVLSKIERRRSMSSLNAMLKRAKKQLKQRINKPTQKHAAQPASCTYVGESDKGKKGGAS